ncbi:hypothetical protein BSPWISOXPB_1115 [uncultured Gammaproteobacteria bacterium]|nr:hypothetical protein BSPWISOXPB_1115 [uncultured Gammaproteobacteria bacterium]
MLYASIICRLGLRSGGGGDRGNRWIVCGVSCIVYNVVVLFVMLVVLFTVSD